MTGRVVKRVSLPLFFVCRTLFAAAQPDEPEALADSISRWREANRADSLADNLSAWWTDASGGRVVVRLLRADAAAGRAFRSRVHDSPRIRIEGFDPDREPFPPAPAGDISGDTLATMCADRYFYPSGTDSVRITLRNRSAETLFFGGEYAVCRFENGRWVELPVGGCFRDILYGFGPQGSHVFGVWLAARVFPAEYGVYRIYKRVRLENPRRDYLLTAEFAVTPFVPFTRFTEQEPCRY